ncbi:MAG: hypothetical protein ACR2QR_12990 [Woeseiaceae bacterium]
MSDALSSYPYDLGSHEFSVTCHTPDAQLWFNRGLAWTYGYNHDEAVYCFEKAAAEDPECAMAHWGIAYAAGPNYNKGWDDFDESDLAHTVDKAYLAACEADRLAPAATPLEQALIAALQRRYPQSSKPVDINAWADEYANAMRGVYQQFGDDLDICTLFAEALIGRTPWQLWDLRTGEPKPGASTLEAVEVLERALALMDERGDQDHAGLFHMYIHTMEMSATPEKALRAAERLRDLVPDAGHLQHMGTHIDVLCGLYQEVVVWNSKAIAADQLHLDRNGPNNFYSTYRCHNFHFKVYGAMLMGRYAEAMDAANLLVDGLGDELLSIASPPMADWLEAYCPVRLHVMIRFGRWQDIIDEPLPEDRELYSSTITIAHYAKGVAHAALGNVAAAETEQQCFAEARNRVPDSRRLFNNTCADLNAIAAEMLAGEIAYRKGDFDEAFAHLRRSVELDDNLPYDEPWGWMQPTRHALGALLLEQGRVAEAEPVFRADLGFDDTLPRACQHPENVWGLHGFVECLHRLGRSAEAELVRPRLATALSRADVPIRASCFCRQDSVASQ